MPSHTIKWPNKNTIVGGVSIVTNLALTTINPSKYFSLALNFPIRCFSIIRNYKHADLKIAFDIAAFAALFFPYGAFIAIGMDLAYEALNYWNTRRCQSSLNNWDGHTLAIVPVDEYVNSFMSLARGGENPFVSALQRIDITDERNARGLLNVPLEGELNLDLAKEHRDNLIFCYW